MSIGNARVNLKAFLATSGSTICFFRNGVKTKTMGTKESTMTSRRCCRPQVRGVERRGEADVEVAEEGKVDGNDDQNKLCPTMMTICKKKILCSRFKF